MLLALEQAKKAQKKGEVPIGAVIVDNKGTILAQGYNRRELDQDATQHAEIIAIKKACHKLHSWRLNHCSLFVTLEPCVMCAGAIINARLQAVYCGALDPNAVALGSVLNLFQMRKIQVHPLVIRGLYQKESRQLLKQFFQKIRKKKQKAKRQQESSQTNKNKLS